MPEKTETKPPIWPVIRRFLQESGRLRAWLFAAILVDLIQAGLIVLGNHYNRKFFEAVSAQLPEQFWHFIWLSAIVLVASVPLSYLKVASMGRFSEGTQAKVRRLIAARSTKLPIAYLEERHSGDMLSVLNADLGKVKILLTNNMLDVIGQPVRALAALAYIISIDWRLALVTVIATPLIFVVISVLSSPVSKRSEEMQEYIGKVNSLAQDGISGAMLVKSFNLADILEKRFHLSNQQALQKGLRIAWLGAIIDGLAFGLSIAPFIIALGYGGYLVIQNQITFGALFAFINLLNFVVNPLGSLPGIITSISEAAGAGRRVFALADHPAERSTGTITQANGHQTAISFDRVFFGYTEDNPILKNVSLEIQCGQTVAIVGPSGGGKSTLIKLILGFYKLNDGQVRLFGHNLDDWQLAAVRDQMAFVAQDTYLFPVSMGENIRLGKPNATQAEIELAARRANIHDFIVSLPQGYATKTGEWGSRLSGGQKQRISLARAILKDAPILLLDEPTSALDTESEALVQQALEQFTQSSSRTTLVIAHRLSTIKNADRVVVLQDGQIVEQGSHHELLALGGVYLDLYQKQFGQPADNPLEI